MRHRDILIVTVSLLCLTPLIQAQNGPPVCRMHKVGGGDSTSTIAAKYNVPQEDLIKALQECIGWTEGTMLQIGQDVCVPPYSDACQHVNAAGNIEECKFYNVQDGDNIASIAGSFKTFTAEALGQLNDVATGTLLRKGLRIKLPPWDKKVCPNPDDNSPGCRYYRVKQGDFMYGIATLFQVDQNELLAANPGITLMQPLSVGQPIKIPPWSEKCGAGIETIPPTDGVKTCRIYQAQQGDSLSSIAIQFGATVSNLIELNSELADPSMLSPGKKVKIPPYDDNCGDGIVITQPVVTTPGSSPVLPQPDASTVVPAFAKPVSTATPAAPQQVSASVVAPAPAVARPIVLTPSPSPPPAAPAPVFSPIVLDHVDLELVLSGKTREEFLDDTSGFIAAVADAAKVDDSSIIIGLVTTVQTNRRLLASGDVIDVTAGVKGVVTETSANLKQAEEDGSLADSFNSTGLAMHKMIVKVPGGTQETLIDSPIPPSESELHKDDGLGIPLIAGAAAGGLAVFITLIVILTVMVKKCKRDGEFDDFSDSYDSYDEGYGQGKGYYYGATATAYVTTASSKQKGGLDPVYNSNAAFKITPTASPTATPRRQSAASTPRGGQSPHAAPRAGTTRQSTYYYATTPTRGSIPSTWLEN